MDELKHQQKVYKRVFGSEDGKEVLRDLTDFCYGLKTTANVESVTYCPYTAARREGRREVLLQVTAMLEVQFSNLYQLYDDPTEDDNG